jgi:Protein of unknown function (DUF433)
LSSVEPVFGDASDRRGNCNLPFLSIGKQGDAGGIGKRSMVLANEVITKHPDVLGGTPVFRGTRVPFQALLDYLEGGQTVNGTL